MITLAIDTCLDACSIALFDSGSNALLAECHEPMSRGHAEALLPMIDAAFGQASIRPSDLQHVIVTRGPGTFTGVRVGLSAAKGLAIGTDVRVGAISSLRALALTLPAGEQGEAPILAAIDARRDELYAGVYSSEGRVLVSPEIVPAGCDPEDIWQGGTAIVGSGANLLKPYRDHSVLPSNITVPNAAVWGPRAARVLDQLEDPHPLYLRKPDAKPPAPDAQVRVAGA